VPLPTISATAANITVPTFDFDTDPFLFRPDAVDTSHWPAGRLPYEVLVGVYLQVGGTRSRLAIVRIISK
jgi:DNA ligase-1